MKIQINLLPSSYFEAKKKQQMVLLGIAGGVVVLAILVGFNVMKFLQAANLKKEIAKVVEEQKKYETVLAEMERIKQQKAQIEERETLLNELLKQQASWPRLLVNFGKAVPQSIWLTHMKNNGGGPKRSFTLEGKALSKQSVADFLKSLITAIPNVEAAGVTQIIELKPEAGNTTFVITFTVTL